MEIEFVKRKNETRIFAATPALISQEDMHPCTSKGELIGVVPAEVGLAKPKTDIKVIIQNISKALDVAEDVAAMIAEGKSPEKKVAVEEKKAPDNTEAAVKVAVIKEVEGIEGKSATELVEYVKTKYPDKDVHLYPSMGKDKIISIIEELELEAELIGG